METETIGMETQQSIEGFRLSPQQERLWRVTGGQDGPEWHARVSVEIAGELDRDVFARALTAVVERHEILRTAFRTLPGLSTLLQMVTAAKPVELCDTAEASAFDLTEPPLLRATLAPPLLTLTLPAMLADAVGLDNLVREIVAACATLRGEGRADEEPMQYIDLSEWQHDLLASEETREGRAYWEKYSEKRASGTSRSPALPFEQASGRGFEPRFLTVPVPEMPGETLLAAWAVLLARLTGESEIPVGVVFDGRKFDELSAALGPFARLLPVRARIGEETRFADLVRSLRETLAEHAQWQEYFMGEPEGEAALPFTFELRGAPAVHRAGGVTFTVRERRSRLAPATLELLIEGGRAEIGYDAARISETEALRLAERFAALLADAAARPESPVAELELLGIGEKQQLAAWNDTTVGFGVEPILHRLVEAQAASTPDRIALEWDGGSWTYAELEKRANRFANRLLREGVKSEDRVAICCERSPEMVLAQLAVWKAGAAWVPLDPSLPAERLAFLLEDARPVVLIAGPGASAELPQGQAIVLDLRTEELADLPADPPAVPVGPGRLAYVIYTSGSTGRPKGVMVPHGAIANRLLWMQRLFPLGADDGVLQKTPFLFDASIWELFLPLFTGARLVLAAPGAHQDPAAMARTIRERNVTVLQLVPSMLGSFLEEDLTGTPLRRLFCGGEALPAPLHERACQLLPGVEVCNLYGPTECAIDVTFHPCRTGGGEGVMPIGRPVDNIRIHLLDRRLLPVPLGLAGELCAAGVGLARGYLGRPDLTAERFIPDPFASAPGGRLYRTGDLVRQGADGTIEFLGRIDHQVKIRGYRIELGEIESCLAAHPSVAEAVVIVREDSPEDRRLAAYLVPRAGQSATDTELREHLAARLPEPMLPSSWTRLSALPRLPSGKIDRGALPAPSAVLEDGGFAAPRTPTEELLAARWAEVLGVERLGRHDNVYTLGWHSLMATRFVSRLRRTFGVELPMRSLFENPTVAGLAARIDEALRGGAGGAVPPIARVPRDRVLPLSFAQRRLWFLDQLQPGSPFYNIPVALRFAGPLDVAALGRSLSEIVARHESLRTRFGQIEDEPVQLIDPPAPVPLPVIDLSALAEPLKSAELRARIAKEALAPFDLATGPLLRASLVRLSSKEHAGLLTVHHIVSDGWSTAVMVRELRALYAVHAADTAGSPSALPSLPLQYADFAVWQRGWLQGEVLDAQVEYWRAQLSGAPPLLKLPTDRERPEAQSFRGATRGRALPAEVAEAVREQARGEGVTLFMAMLAAGATLLGWHAGQDDVVIGTDVSGRDRGETEGVIGFFINQLALRLRLDGDPTFRELLGRARETALAAYAHQDLPFDRLVEVLNPERGRRHAPVFQVKINLHDEPPPALDLPGLSIEPLPVARETAQFDWILNLMDAGDSFLASIEYATDLFDAATIDRMLGNFEVLLRTVGERPDIRLRELFAVLAESDTRQREAAAAERRQGKQQSLKMARRQAVGASA